MQRHQQNTGDNVLDCFITKFNPKNMFNSKVIFLINKANLVCSLSVAADVMVYCVRLCSPSVPVSAENTTF